MIDTNPTPTSPAPVPAGLLPVGGDGCYELKFLLPDTVVEPVIAWSRAHLLPDPHAETPGDDTYRIHSLYFDTDGLDVFHRTPGYGDTKYRIRRYGREPLVYLEQKSKKKGWVSKRRTAVSEADLALLTLPDASGWEGDWFRRRLLEQRLAPRCEIEYRRLARVGEAEGAPIRLTLDRSLRCAPGGALRLSDLSEQHTLEIRSTILELKFRHALPRLFRELIREHGLMSTPSSKYRRAAVLSRLAGGLREE